MKRMAPSNQDLALASELSRTLKDSERIQKYPPTLSVYPKLRICSNVRFFRFGFQSYQRIDFQLKRFIFLVDPHLVQWNNYMKRVEEGSTAEHLSARWSGDPRRCKMPHARCDHRGCASVWNCEVTVRGGPLNARGENGLRPWCSIFDEFSSDRPALSCAAFLRVSQEYSFLPVNLCLYLLISFKCHCFETARKYGGEVRCREFCWRFVQLMPELFGGW